MLTTKTSDSTNSQTNTRDMSLEKLSSGTSFAQELNRRRLLVLEKKAYHDIKSSEQRCIYLI
jgi:hypothetical protein